MRSARFHAHGLIVEIRFELDGKAGKAGHPILPDLPTGLWS